MYCENKLYLPWILTSWLVRNLTVLSNVAQALVNVKREFQ